MRTLNLAIEPAKIVIFKGIIESYDNLATLRTEDPRLHHLRLWLDEAAEPDVAALLASLASEFSLRILGS